MIVVLSRTRLATLMLLVAWVAAPVRAQLAEYRLDGASAGASPSITASSTVDGLTASALTAVGTHGTLDYPRTLFYSSWPTAGSGIDREQYFEFTLTPSEGRSVTYRSITLSVASGGHGSPRVEIRGSTDGFAESDRLLHATRYVANTTVQILADLDISELGTQAVPVTLRIHIEKGDSGFAGILHTDAFGGGTSVRIDGEVE